MATIVLYRVVAALRRAALHRDIHLISSAIYYDMERLSRTIFQLDDGKLCNIGAPKG